jgi:hypothetical protein
VAADWPPRRMAGSLRRLGYLAMVRGHPEDAAGWFGQALHHARGPFGPGEADVLVTLGDFARRTGRLDEARTRYTEAQRVLASLGSSEEARVRERLTQLDQPRQG